MSKYMTDNGRGIPADEPASNRDLMGNRAFHVAQPGPSQLQPQPLLQPAVAHSIPYQQQYGGDGYMYAHARTPAPYKYPAQAAPAQSAATGGRPLYSEAGRIYEPVHQQGRHYYPSAVPSADSGASLAPAADHYSRHVSTRPSGPSIPPHRDSIGSQGGATAGPQANQMPLPEILGWNPTGGYAGQTFTLYTSDISNDMRAYRIIFGDLKCIPTVVKPPPAGGLSTNSLFMTIPPLSEAQPPPALAIPGTVRGTVAVWLIAEDLQAGVEIGVAPICEFTYWPNAAATTANTMIPSSTPTNQPPMLAGANNMQRSTAYPERRDSIAMNFTYSDHAAATSQLPPPQAGPPPNAHHVSSRAEPHGEWHKVNPSQRMADSAGGMAEYGTSVFSTVKGASDVYAFVPGPENTLRAPAPDRKMAGSESAVFPVQSYAPRAQHSQEMPMLAAPPPRPALPRSEQDDKKGEFAANAADPLYASQRRNALQFDSFRQNPSANSAATAAAAAAAATAASTTSSLPLGENDDHSGSNHSLHRLVHRFPASTASSEHAAPSSVSPGLGRNKRAQLRIRGDLNEMCKGWSADEWAARRRLVQFWRHQTDNVINCTFAPVSSASRAPGSIVISCIYWDTRQACFVTSVDCIYLLESLTAMSFSIEEKNRIRRNLEGYRPLTISKLSRENLDFFRLIMAFPAPKPRNIEKDLKVFPWSQLASALTKIIGKYSIGTMGENVHRISPSMSPLRIEHSRQAQDSPPGKHGHQPQQVSSSQGSSYWQDTAYRGSDPGPHRPASSPPVPGPDRQASARLASAGSQEMAPVGSPSLARLRDRYAGAAPGSAAVGTRVDDSATT